MKCFRLYLCLVILFVAGCQKPTHIDASRALEQSFQASEPALKQAITTASTRLQAGEYTEVARVLNPVLKGRELTPAQKEAAGLLFQQINQALTANPNLDSKELYELRVNLHEAVNSGKRF